MRVLAATTAGEGHAGPVLAIARACSVAGHTVRVAAPASLAPRVQAAGLVHAPVDDADPAGLQAVWSRLPGLARTEANAVVVAEVFGGVNARAALPGMRQLVDAWHPDVVLREPAEVASCVVASQASVPQVQVAIGLSSLDDLLLPLLDGPLRQLGGDVANAWAAPRWTSVPPGLDVASTHPSGPVSRYRTDVSGTSSSALPDWWGGNGDPLVYVSFGSVAAGIGFFPDAYRAVVEALAPLPVRVLLTTGAAGDPETLGPLPPSVHVERWWPQRDVLPSAAAVVCHGGFGTTLAALASGLPLVVVPLFASDQHLTAPRVQEVGAGLALDGPAALPRLGQAVERLLHEDSFRDVARLLAAEVDALPPVVELVAELERLVA